MALETERKRRLANFELLRILSMVLIVCHHIAVHTAWPFSAWGHGNSACEEEQKKVDLQPVTDAQAQFVIGLFASCGKAGVNIFLLLSGYFLNGRQARARSIVQPWVSALFWSWSILLVEFICRTPANKLHWWDVKPSLFPVLTGSYWFLTPFFGALILSPVMSRICTIPTRREHLGTLFAMTILTICVWPYNLGENFAYNYVWLFIYICCLGSALHRYQQSLKRIPLWVTLGVLVSLLVLNGASIHYLVYTTNESARLWSAGHGGIVALTMNLYSPVSLLLALTCFVLFMRIPDFSSRLVDEAASVTFGVYLIHDNRIFRWRLWKGTIHAERYLEMPMFSMRLLAIVALVYIGCSFVEKLRQLVLARYENLAVTAVLGVIDVVDEKVVTPIMGQEDEEATKTYQV